MPSIPITDGVNVTADAQLAPWSSLAQYAQDLPKLAAGSIDLARWRVLTLADPAVHSLSSGLSVERPIQLGGGAPALTLGGNAAFEFGVLTGALFSSDNYGDNLAIQAGQCAVRLGITAGVSAGASLAAGSATFGLDAAAGIAVDCYRTFPAADPAPTVLAALEQCLSELVIPFRPADVAAMPAGAVATLSGSGSLKFSGSANLLAVANPLATLALPAPAPALAVTQGAAVTVGASWELAAEYQVRVQKLDAGHARIGWYRKRSSDFSITASAAAGISAGTATTDLFPRVISAISPDAHAVAAELAGLSTADADAIEDTVRRAVNRNLEVALSAEFGALQSDEAAFLYELDLAALDDAARAALAQALRGELTALAALPKGVTEVRSILTRVTAHHLAFRINLLGIFNFTSVSRLALQGTVTWTPSTGELVIADQATASRIQTAAINFGADEEKLRHVMAESFLLTAAYRGSRTALAPPALKSTHSFFRLDNATSRDELERCRMALAAVQLPPPPLPPGVDSFGRTTFHLEAAYDDPATRALFLDDSGQPRTVEAYERAGRIALQLTIPPGAVDGFRLAPAGSDPMWERMKNLGPANFTQLFPTAHAAVIGADYLAIRWWADAMQETAELIARILRPGAADSAALRQQLAAHLKQVAERAHAQFGSPWGLIAMYLVSGARALASGAVAGTRFVFAGGV